MLDRRAFLRGALLAAPLIAVPSFVLAKPTYFLPPRGGWLDMRPYYLVNLNAVYYFSSRTQGYVETLASSAIPRFGGKWEIQREPPPVVNPCAEFRTTFRTYQRGVDQTFCIEFDDRGVVEVETEARDVPQVVVGPISWERLVNARAVGPDGSFVL